MAQFVLEILDGDRAGDVVTLGERTLRIGRKPQNDLVVADEKASGVHAEIAFEGGRHVLRDLGSTNGTTMDGRKVTEVVLGSGDVITIGRVRLRFRGEGEAAAAAAGGSPEAGFAVGTIDAARLQAAKSGSRSVTLLVSVLAVALAAGGYLWFAQRSAGSGETAAVRGPRAEVLVANNKIAQEVANCEQDAGWDLAVAGAGFRASGRAHTGNGAFEAQRGESPLDFAVAASAVEQRVLAGRTVVATAHLQTSAGARVGLRLAFWSSVEGNPFRFRTGAPVVARDGWQAVEVAAAVPVGTDRCRLEIVALLPQADSAAAFDDVALLEAGQEAAIERKVGESGTVLGTGQSLAVRSMDPDQPATVLALVPDGIDAAFAGLAQADQLALSDVGAAVTVAVDDRAATFAVQGCDRVEIALPAESAGAVLAVGDQGFVGVDAKARFVAKEVLLGDRQQRCMVTLANAGEFVGRLQGGTYRLQVPAASFSVVLGFRQERQQARELLRRAEEAAREGQLGAALDAVRELLRTVPHDAETLAQALARRGEWQEVMAARLRRLAADLDEAEFFDTRGGFERVIAGLDDLLAVFGRDNVEDPAAVAAMRTRAVGRLQQLDAQRANDQRPRLEKMAAAFEQASQPGLAALVRDYMARQLTTDAGNGGGGKE